MKGKTAIFNKQGINIELTEVNIPELKEGEILVKTEYTTLCRSDLNTYSGKRIEKTPTILGHEIVGRIVEFGANCNRTDERGEYLKENDRITWAIYASNPNDVQSKNGIPQKAADLFKYGHELVTPESNLHGGLSEYIVLRKHTPLAKLDLNLPVQLGAIVNCAISTVAGAIRLAGNLNGKKVLISGAGNLGIYACAMSKTLGASRVVATDTSNERLEWSLKCGADTALLADQTTKEKIKQQFGTENPFDVVLEFSGVDTAMENGISMLAIGGTAVLVGATHPGLDIRINPEKVIRNLLSIKGLHNYNADDFITAVSFIEKNHNHFPFLEMIYEGFTLDQVNQAFEYAINFNPFRVGIKMSN